VPREYRRGKLPQPRRGQASRSECLHAERGCLFQHVPRTSAKQRAQVGEMVVDRLWRDLRALGDHRVGRSGRSMLGVQRHCRAHDSLVGLCLERGTALHGVRAFGHR
jgi:hypothetical protein